MAKRTMMSEERFIAINMNEGITRDQARGLWDSAPLEARRLLTDTPEAEDRVRQTARKMAARFAHGQALAMTRLFQS